MAQAENLLPGGPPSPRVSLATDKFSAIADALESVGHVVLENCFSHRDLADIREYARWKFEYDDKLREKGEMPQESLSGYFSGMHDLDLTNNALLIEMVDRSRLPQVMAHLCGGPAVMFLDERALRRADPRFPLRGVGFHSDDQLTAFSDKSFTAWMPLTELGSDVCGFALFHKNFDSYQIENEIFHQAVQEYDEPSEATARRVAERFESTRAVYATYLRHLHVPLLEIGDVVLFSGLVRHGTQFNENATRTRLSLDFRWTASFDWKTNAAFAGRKAVLFDPDDGMSPTFIPPDTEVAFFETTNRARAKILDLISEIASLRAHAESIQALVKNLDAVQNSTAWRLLNRGGWLGALAKRMLS